MIKAGTFGPGLAAGVDPKAIGFAFLAYLYLPALVPLLRPLQVCSYS